MVADILVALLRKRRWILIMTFLCAVLAFLLACWMPKSYSSKAIVRLNGESSDNVASLLSGGASAAKSFLGQKSSQSDEVFSSILMSREVLLQVVAANHLDTVYKKKPKNLIIKMLSKDLTLDASGNGLIECEAEQKDSIRVCKVLSSWITIAVARYTDLENARILQTTGYLRGREQEMMDSFELSRDSLLRFYRKNNIFDAQEQVLHSIDALANIETAKGNLQVEENVGRFSEGSNSGKVALIEARQKAVANFQQDILNGKSGRILMNPHAGVPLVIEEKRLQSKLTLYASALQTIVKERLAMEAKLSSQAQSAQMVQQPYIPDWKDKPKRSVYLLLGFFLGLFFSSTVALVLAIQNGEISISDSFLVAKNRVIEELIGHKN